MSAPRWSALVRAPEPELVARLRELTIAAVADATPTPRPGWSSTGLYEDAMSEVRAFWLRRGEQIPLHDHPGMTVYMRVLAGALRVRSFTRLHSDYAECTGDALVTPDSPVWRVAPERDNLHAIEAREDSVFLDVLRPRYDPGAGRECRYYEALSAGGALFRLRVCA